MASERRAMGVISSLGDAAGEPRIDERTCTLCGACAEICPTGVLSEGGGAIRVDNSVHFGCIACGHCMMVCPSDSIVVTGRRLSPGDAVPLPPTDKRATAEQLEALLVSRRSVRRFAEGDVPRGLIERVIAAAATAPMGIPPWEVGITVFHGRDRVRHLAEDTARGYQAMLKFMDNRLARPLLSLLMKRAARAQLRTFILPLGRAIVEEWRAGRDAVFYGAPAALLFHSSPYADVADAVIACTYAMVAAESLGLGTCMIGCAAPILARRKDLLKKHGIPEGHKPAIVLILGYPATKFLKAVRRPFLMVRGLDGR